MKSEWRSGSPLKRKMLAASRLDGAARVVGELASSAAYLPLVMAGGASDDREALVRTVEVLVLAVASGGERCMNE